MSRPTRHPGFTLLEVLAASAMVATLAATLFVSLHIAFRARRSAEAAVDSVRKTSLAIERIKTDLASAMVPVAQSATGRLTLGGPFTAVSGGGMAGSGSDSLSFYTTLADLSPTAGRCDVVEIEYLCLTASNTNEVQLVRRMTTNLLAPTAIEPPDEIICRGVRQFLLRYYDGAAWQDTWDSTAQNNALPTAVEVNIEWATDRDAAPLRVSRIVPIACGAAQASTGSTGGTP